MLGLLKMGRTAGMKAINSFRPSLPSHRYNNAEAREYDYGVKAINVIGLDPSVVNECPVCQQLLSDLSNGSGDRIRQHTDVNEDKPNEVFEALWVIKHNGPGHMRAHMLQA